MQRRAFTTIDWRKYLDSNQNPRVERFLETRGYDVMHQISTSIHTAAREGKSEVAILVHPHASAVSLVPKEDYIDALNHCMKWFETNEEYEMCARIVKFKDDVLMYNAPRRKRVHKKLI